MPKGRVRKALLEDARAIAAVHVAVSREIYENLIPASVLAAISVERRVRQWHQIIGTADARAGTAVFVTDDPRNGIVGFACCSRQRSKEMVAKGFDGEFQSIYLLHSFRGCGLGRSLVVEMARCLRHQSMSGASCWVLRENNDARRFYESLAGQVVGERTDQVDQCTTLVEVAYGWESLDMLTGR